MKQTHVNLEIESLAPLLKGMPRSKQQIHGLNESDCEILKLNSKTYLATSTDSVSEEWVYQLYKTPETMAWMSVQGTLSDLVACGVTPSGFLLSALWPMQNENLNSFKAKVFAEIKRTLKSSNVALLGGDQGEALSFSLTGVAMGVTQTKPLTRLGIKPGDYLCTVGELGTGPALGFRYLLGAPESKISESMYRPKADLKLAPLLLKYARAAIDTSDGFASAVHQLSTLNDLRFEIDFGQIQISNVASEFCRDQSLSPLSLLFGEHGDYQPLFAISPKNLAKLKRILPKIQVIGHALPKKVQQHQILHLKKVSIFEPGLLARMEKNDLKSLKQAFDHMLSSLEGLGWKDVTEK